jgi:hypothetical protein
MSNGTEQRVKLVLLLLVRPVPVNYEVNDREGKKKHGPGTPE